jgi:hypothetical protein
MKDFDVERAKRRLTEGDRMFILCGEEFVVRPAVKPETLLPFAGIDQDTDPLVALAAIDDLFKALVEPRNNSVARYEKIRKADDDDVLNNEDLLDLAMWLIEVASGRTPTGSPSSSTLGDEPTGESSTESSSSPDTPLAMPV